MAQVDMPKNDFNTAQGEPKKKFDKVVRGKVTLKEQNDIQKIANDFLAEDLKTVKDRIIAEYLIPMLKNGLCSIFNSAINIALWGDDRSRSSSTNYSSSSRQRNSYDRYYQDGQSSRPGPSGRPARTLQNLDFEGRYDADKTLNEMYDALCKYKQVSVGDLWDMMGVSNESTDYNYGWYNLDGAYIKGIPGGYRLVLPRPIPLS
ncbi:hypothetical protein [Dialister hominis]|uniref:hypothetical protein n=1 Tax=Dialister hominis TaxID=2582419 RepID=UPI003FF13620